MSYKSSDINEMFGIPPRRVQYLVELGAVGCKSDPGRGNVGRTFTKDNVFEILVANELYAVCHIGLRDVKEIMKMLSDEHMSMLKCATYDKRSNHSFFLYVRHSDGNKIIHIAGELGRKVNAGLPNLFDANSTVVVNLSKLRSLIH